MDSRIAILTTHSLLADGLISSLRNHHHEAMEFKVFDRTQTNILQEIADFKPLVLILEELDKEQAGECSLKQILALLPSVLVICLHLGSPDIQVIHSESCPASGVEKLLEIIRLSSNPSTWMMADQIFG
jgi:hypothetical protein